MSHKKLVGLDQQIIEEYLAGNSSTSLSVKYNASNVTIINILKRNDVARRSLHGASLKYPYDENFFDQIDNEAKAYFMGLMYADGCNHGGSIGLSLTDRDIVQSFKVALNSEAPLYVRSNKYYALKVFGRHISAALSAKGCHQRKSLSLQFPEDGIVPIDLMHHFIRGYFDGDGCIHVRSIGWNKVVHICGTERLLTKMASYLPCDSYVRPRHKARIWFLGIYRMIDIERFADWLYDDASIRMDRKRDLFLTQKNALVAA